MIFLYIEELSISHAKKKVQTFNRLGHIKHCSQELEVLKMQIKTTLRFHLTPIRIAIIQNTTPKCWQGCGIK
jgi:hypothetical protein